jgi:F-type H+-transporting ATPase subunit delta
VTTSLIGRRYASALLALSEERSVTEVIGRDLRELAASWHDSRDLRNAFENPSVSLDSRRKILRELAEASGMNPLLRDTLLLLSDRGRMTHLPEVAEAFEILAAEKSGSVRAEVVSATELPAEYFEGLRRTLEQVTGKHVVVSSRVDASLIGGVVTRVGDQLFDGSVKHQLNQLKDELSR